MTDSPNRLQLPFDLHLWSCSAEPGSRLRIRSRADVERRLVENALRDPYFRARLRTDARPMVEEELGSPLPQRLQVEVLEEGEGTRFLIIPHNPRPEAAADPRRLEDAVEWVLDGRELPFVSAAQGRELVVRAWTEPTYRQELLNDPAVVLRRDFHMNIEDGVILNARMEGAELLYIVIPELLGYREMDVEVQSFTSLVNQPLVIGSQLVLPTVTTFPPCCFYTSYKCP